MPAGSGLDRGAAPRPAGGYELRKQQNREQQQRRDIEVETGRFCSFAGADLDVAVPVLRADLGQRMFDADIDEMYGRRGFLAVEAEMQMRLTEPEQQQAAQQGCEQGTVGKKSSHRGLAYRSERGAQSRSRTFGMLLHGKRRMLSA
ncbi:hypothetical protein [Solimonas variicoloris]|uniref:hypothetical protein n=1 Tax=Solimonas variicoloris TaxID=254408 RepID=UPI0012B5166D|nr:hypothetical protein [Solimonas variicoloris]